MKAAWWALAFAVFSVALLFAAPAGGAFVTPATVAFILAVGSYVADVEEPPK